MYLSSASINLIQPTSTRFVRFICVVDCKYKDARKAISVALTVNSRYHIDDRRRVVKENHSAILYIYIYILHYIPPRESINLSCVRYTLPTRGCPRRRRQERMTVLFFVYFLVVLCMREEKSRANDKPELNALASSVVVLWINWEISRRWNIECKLIYKLENIINK